MSIDLSAVSVVLTVSYDPGLATFPQYDSHLWVWVCSVVKTALLLPWKIFSRVACGVLDQFGIESQGPSCCWRRSRKCDCNAGHDGSDKGNARFHFSCLSGSW